MNRNGDGGSPLLDVVGNGSLNDLNDIDLNFMAEPWSESDDDESPTTNEPTNHPPHTNEPITHGPPHESPVAQEPPLLSGPPKDSDITSPNLYNNNAPPTTNDLYNTSFSTNGPPKDNEILSPSATGGPPISGPPKDNEITTPSTVTHHNGPPTGPPKDSEIISPTMYSLSLGGTNPPPPSTNTNTSLYDNPKAPSTYTRGRKSRQKAKKFSNSQIGRFDKESEHPTKKKEEEKKTSITTDPLSSSPVIAPVTPEGESKDTISTAAENPTTATAEPSLSYISPVIEQQPSTILPNNTEPTPSQPSSAIESQTSNTIPMDQQPSYVSPIDVQPVSVVPTDQAQTFVNPVDVQPVSVVPADQTQTYVNQVDAQPTSADQTQTYVNPVDSQPTSAVPADQAQTYVMPTTDPSQSYAVSADQQIYTVSTDPQQQQQQQPYSATSTDQQQYYATVVDANGNTQYVDPNNPQYNNEQYASYYAQYGYNFGYGYGYGYGYTDGSAKPEMVENSTMTENTEEVKDKTTEPTQRETSSPVETADEAVQTVVSESNIEVEKEDVGLQTKEVKVKDSSVLTDPDQRRPIYRQKDRIPDGVRLPATVVEYDFLKDDDYLFSPLSSKNLPLNLISKSTESLDAFTNNVSSTIVTDKNNKYVCFIDGKNIHVIQEQKKFKFILGGHNSDIIHIAMTTIENKYTRLLSIDEEGVIIVHEFDESKNIIENGKLSPDFCTIIMAIKSNEYQIYCAAFQPNHPNSFVVGTNMKCALYFNIEDNLWKRKINAVEEDSEEESDSSDSSSSSSSSSDEEMKKKKKERRRRRKEKKREKRRRKIIQKKEQDRDNRLKLGIKAVKLEHGCDVRCLAFNTDGSILATGGEDGLVRLWNMNEIGDFQLPFFYFSPVNEQKDRKPMGSAKPINSLEFACYNSKYCVDAILIVGSNKNRRIQILDTFNLNILHELNLGRKTLWKWDEKLKCLIAYKNNEPMLFSFHLSAPLVKEEETQSPIKLKSKSDFIESSQAFKFYCECPFNFDGVQFDYAIGWKLNKPIHSFTNLQGIATGSLNKNASNKWYLLFRHQSSLEVCEVDENLISPECRTACPLLGSLQWDIDELWEEARVKREALEWEDLKVELEGDMALEKERWEKDFKEKQLAWEKQSKALKTKLEKEKRTFLNDEIKAAVEQELRVICEPKVLADLNHELRDSLEEELKGSIEEEIRNEYKPEILAKLTDELRESLEEQVKISLERELRPVLEERLKDELTVELEQKLTADVKSSLEQKYAEECRAKVTEQLRESLEPEVKMNLERELKEEFEPIIKENLRNEIKEDIKDQVENEVKTEIRNEREADLVQSLSNELRDSLQFEVRDQMTEEMKDSVRKALEEQLTDEVKSSLEQKLTEECREKVMKELSESLESEVKMNLEQMYSEECREKVTEELKQQLEPEVKMNLEKMYADECRDKIYQELKQSLESEVKMNLEKMYAEECRDKIAQELRESLEPEIKQHLETTYAEEYKERITNELREKLTPEVKMNLEQLYAEECREKVTEELKQSLEPEIKMNLERALTEELRETLEPEIKMSLERALTEELRQRLEPEIRRHYEDQYKNEISSEPKTATEGLSTEAAEAYKEEINELKLENETIEKEHEDLLMCLYDMEEKVKKYRHKLKSLDALSDNESDTDSDYDEEEEEEEEVEEIEVEEEVKEEKEEEEKEEEKEKEIEVEPTPDHRELEVEPKVEDEPVEKVEPVEAKKENETVVKPTEEVTKPLPVPDPEQGTHQLFSPELKDPLFMASAPSPLPSPTQIPFTIPSTVQTPIFNTSNSENENVPVITEEPKEPKEPKEPSPNAWDVEAIQNDTIPFDVPAPSDHQGFGAWDMDTLQTDAIPFEVPASTAPETPFQTSDVSSPSHFVTPAAIPSFTVPAPETSKPETSTISEMTGPEVSSYTMPTPEISAPIPGFSIPSTEPAKPASSSTPEAVAPVPDLQVPEMIKASEAPAAVQGTMEIPPSAFGPEGTAGNDGWGFTDQWDFTEISDLPDRPPEEEKEPVQPESEVAKTDGPSPSSPTSKKPLEDAVKDEHIPFDMTTTSGANDGWNIDGWDTGNDFVAFDNPSPLTTTTTTTTTPATTATATTGVDAPATTTTTTTSLFSPKSEVFSKSPLPTNGSLSSANPTSAPVPSSNYSFDGWNITSPLSASKSDKKSDNGWGFTDWTNDTTTTTTPTTSTTTNAAPASTTTPSNHGWGFDTSFERKSSTHTNSFADALFKHDPTPTSASAGPGNPSSSSSWFNSSNSTPTTDSLFKTNASVSGSQPPWFSSSNNSTTKSEDPNSKKSISPLTLGSNKFGLAKSSSSSFGFGQRSPPSNASFSPGSTSGFFNAPPSNASSYSYSRRRGKSDF